MQTILWFTNFLGSVFCSGLSLYFYLAHDDLEHGSMEPFDISEQISKYWPMEFFVQAFITLSCLLNGNWMLFLFNLPMAVHNGRQYMRSEYKFHIISLKEYRNLDRNIKRLKIKLVFYGFLMAFTLLRLVFAVSNMAIYWLFGKTYSLWFF